MGSINNKDVLKILLVLFLILFVFNLAVGKAKFSGPQASGIGPNATQVMSGNQVTFYVEWDILGTYTNLSGYIFSYSTNNGTTWTNNTWTSFPLNVNNAISYVTKTIPSGITKYIWRVYANDTDGGWDDEKPWAGLPYLSVIPAAPIATINSPTNTTYTTSSIWSNVTTDKSASWCSYSLDKSANVTMSGSGIYWNKLMTSVSEALHNLTVYCNESSGNIGTSSVRYFTVDTTAPSITINSPTNTTYATQNILTNVTTNEPAKWCGYSLDNSANVTMTNTSATAWQKLMTAISVSEASHNVTVYCNDSYGNMGASSTKYFSMSYLTMCTVSLNNNLVVALSQYKACGNDTVGIIISNISICDGYNLKVTYDDGAIELCPFQRIAGGQAICYFQVPNRPADIGKSIHIIVDIAGVGESTKYANLTIMSRPFFNQCFDTFGSPIWCNEACTDTPHQRKWDNVSAISLPLHFTFGVIGTNTGWDSTSLGNNSNLYGFLSGKLKDCGNSTTTNYETHNITRYRYTWTIDYDTIISAYSKTDYVPMFVGNNQQLTNSTTAAIKMAGSCAGSLCYTEVPLCGDLVCDISGGETCRTCPADCGGTADKSGDPRFSGTCGATNGGCTFCTSTDPSFVDKRGCVINYKTEGEDCQVDCECGSLKCPKDTIQETFLAPKGKCCPSEEIWNNVTNRCEIKRKLSLESVNLEFYPINWADWGIAFDFGQRLFWCCPDRSDAGFIRVNYTIKNSGIIDEIVDIESQFTSEKSTGGWVEGGQYHELLSKRMIIPAGGEPISTSFVWSCVRTKIASCEAETAGVSSRTFEYDFSNLDPALIINLVPNSTGPVPSGLTLSDLPTDMIGIKPTIQVICDTRTLACAKTPITPNGKPVTTTNFGSAEAVCGGRNIPGFDGKGTIITPIFAISPGMSTRDCNPFVN